MTGENISVIPLHEQLGLKEAYSYDTGQHTVWFLRGSAKKGSGLYVFEPTEKTFDGVLKFTAHHDPMLIHYDFAGDNFNMWNALTPSPLLALLIGRNHDVQRTGDLALPDEVTLTEFIRDRCFRSVVPTHISYLKNLTNYRYMAPVVQSLARLATVIESSHQVSTVSKITSAAGGSKLIVDWWLKK